MEKYPTKRAYATGKLYKFLKEKGVYKQFVDNCKKQRQSRNKKKGYKDASGISSAFLWKETPEGYDFWNDINNGAYKVIR